MKPTIHARAMLRIPQFSVDASLKDNWHTLKNSIRHSSPNFYHNIKDVEVDQLEDLPAPIAFTVWKYFNRAKFRPVPYGHFAGIAMVDIKTAQDKIQIGNQLIHPFVNWDEQVEYNIAELKRDPNQHYLFANSSYYHVKECIRYVSFFEDQYQLSEIESDPIVAEILKTCRRPMPYGILLQELAVHGLGEGEGHRLIDSLICLQLLIKSTKPNIIGEDFFRRSAIVPIAETDYLIAERQVLAGGLGSQQFKHIPEMVSLLAAKLPPQSISQLTDFAARFTSRYGDAEIGLMMALDPECGIGYGELEFLNNAGSLAGTFASRYPRDTLGDAFKDGLSALIINNGKFNTTIELRDLLTGINDNDFAIPNSLSVLLSRKGSRLYAESIGGSTSISMMGRFTLASEQITEHCRAIASAEGEANPGIIFFDIGYTAEKAVDNINRRQSIYRYQLNLLNYDTSDEPLSITDIMVSVKHGTVVLRSKRASKRLIPRLCSAYNYTRSDLGVFRFLCDLQSQGLQTDLTFDLQEIIPGLEHYPELRFKNIVLSPEKWKVSSSTDLEELNVPRYFLAGTGDQTLCFDKQSKEDMQMFERYLRKQPSVYIQEAFIDSARTINDTNNQPYHAQILLSLVHTQKIYRALQVPAIDDLVRSVPRMIPPGEEWLYFEIYCHPYTADQLLKGAVAGLLYEHSTVIEDWFFIRYTEHGHHLRLRIRLKSLVYMQGVTTALARLLQPDVACGKVSNLLLNSYKQETSRYSGNHIRDIERHFYFDSKYVLSILPLELSEFAKYHLCDQVIQAIVVSKIFDDGLFELIIYEIALSYQLEHQVVSADFKKINSAFKSYLHSSVPVLNSSQQDAFFEYIQSFIRTLKLCQTPLRDKLFADLMHMHFNRLFPIAQRAHELIYFNFRIKTRHMS